MPVSGWQSNMVSSNAEAIYRKWNQRRWNCSLESCCSRMSWENLRIRVWSKTVQISNRDACWAPTVHINGRPKRMDQTQIYYIQYVKISEPKWGGMLAAHCSDAASLAVCLDSNLKPNENVKCTVVRINKERDEGCWGESWNSLYW